MARRMASDQLAPFDGMHGYTKDKDYFEGTIFRLPFRKTGVKTALRDSTDHIDQHAIRYLLDAYLATARISLLFLHTVNSIQFYVRGNNSPIWSVSASRPEGLEGEVFRNTIVSTLKEHQNSRHDLWRIGLMDIDSSPADVPKIGKGSSKITECGIAACIQHNQVSKPGFESKPIYNDGSTKIEEAAEQRVFCKLPTTSSSSLPVSFHASFAITGDRKTIAIEGQDHLATWNRWLLTENVADFYAEFLSDAAPRYGESAFNMWPKTPGKGPSTLSSVVAQSFWSKIMKGKHRNDQLYPLSDLGNASKETGRTDLKRPMARVRRVLHMATTVEKAHFDFLTSSNSSALQPLLSKLPLNIVRPPSQLGTCIKSAAKDLDLVELGPAFLATIFRQEESCEILEKYLSELANEEARSAFYSVFLTTLTPRVIADDTAALNVLDGCRIVPRPQLNLRLGQLILNPKPDTKHHLLANETEQRLFAFASDMMVHTTLFKSSKSVSPFSLLLVRDPFQDIMKGHWNMRKLDLRDVGRLLSVESSPTKSPKPSNEQDIWLIKLWDYLNNQSRVIRKALETKATSDTAEHTAHTLLTEAELWDQPIYKILDAHRSKYITPRAFISGPYIVHPDTETHQKLCDGISGLKCVNRSCIPFFLAKTETNLLQVASFERLIRALKQIQQTTNISAKISLDAALTQEMRQTLRDITSNLLKNYKKPEDVPDLDILKCLPMWPRVNRLSDSDISSYIAASEASFCQHSPMMMPWIKNLTQFVDPVTVNAYQDILPNLGVRPMTVKVFWNFIQKDLPASLSDGEARHQHLRLLRHLAKHGIKTKARIAPNGTGNLCKTNSLYDHDDPIFSEAFQHDEDRFVHHDLRSLRAFFVLNGLRARPSGGPVDYQDFVQCALAVNERWSEAVASVLYDGPAAAVASYLEFDIPAFRQWPASAWQQISILHIFKVKDYVLDQPIYRQRQMQNVAERCQYCALQDVAQVANTRICWSQLPFLEHPPTNYVFTQRPGGPMPALETVFKHLQYLVAHWEEACKEDLSEYLQDVQACYEHLQQHPASINLPGIRDVRIWFNLESTTTDKIFKAQLQGSLLPATLLCLDAPCKYHIVQKKCVLGG